MSDLVERLRSFEERRDRGGYCLNALEKRLMDEAAAEIARLRSELERPQTHPADGTLQQGSDGARWVDNSLLRHYEGLDAEVMALRAKLANERDAFEVWAERDNRRLDPQEFEERVPENNHYYAAESTNDAYIGWRARSALLSAHKHLSEESKWGRSDVQSPPQTEDEK